EPRAPIHKRFDRTRIIKVKQRMVFQLLRLLERPGTIAKQSRAAHGSISSPKRRSVPSGAISGGQYRMAISIRLRSRLSISVVAEMRTSIAGCRLVKRGRRGISHSEAKPVVVVMESWRVRVAEPS